VPGGLAPLSFRRAIELEPDTELYKEELETLEKVRSSKAMSTCPTQHLHTRDTSLAVTFQAIKEAAEAADKPL
jgi:hypothetical protein